MGNENHDDKGRFSAGSGIGPNSSKKESGIERSRRRNNTPPRWVNAGNGILVNANNMRAVSKTIDAARTKMAQDQSKYRK